MELLKVQHGQIARHGVHPVGLCQRAEHCQGALDCAEAAGRGDRDGLKMLYDCLALEVQLCNQIGHPRPEEGSEHYFAGSAQRATGSDSSGSSRAATEKPASLLPATRAGLWAGAHTGEN